MVYLLTDDDLQVFQYQQLTVLRNSLIEHLLTLPNPPDDWAVLEPVLIPQIRLLRSLGFVELQHLKRMIEALHFIPGLLGQAWVIKLLKSPAKKESISKQLQLFAQRQYQANKGDDCAS
ncbi:hypothetical protein [Pelagibaculum spongiae]|uniref:Uncharacterized protein n=1 Tax=Pelagibaculum spongiae TaxID=2080658 RepID=A0A2V1GZK3_9GAMM|nr:hypothetical protein [Pelagibaculum spongiae]PVZ71613.1 hypothetical protein DC094_00815 [Pelagibaculum spongiae]